MRKIIIIDDNVDVSANIEYMLSKSGYAALVAHDAAKGIALVQKELPDLIIMDIMLPDMQGGEAVNKIKKFPSCKEIPVIFLTGLMSGTKGNEGIETINVDGKSYPALGKPFDFPQLLNTIKKSLI